MHSSLGMGQDEARMLEKNLGHFSFQYSSINECTQTPGIRWAYGAQKLCEIQEWWEQVEEKRVCKWKVSMLTMGDCHVLIFGGG